MCLTRPREKSMPPGPLGCLVQMVHRGQLESVLCLVTMDSAGKASALQILFLVRYASVTKLWCQATLWHSVAAPQRPGKNVAAATLHGICCSTA